MFRLLFLLLAAVCSLPAASDWLRLSSPNFELITNAGEREARRTIEYFEQVRDFFMRMKSSQVTTRLPVTIIGFRNPKDYKPYTISEVAAAYFTGDESRDYIVLSNVGEEAFPSAVHEYMHLLVRHSGLKLPNWLNEGLAEVHSTIRPMGGQILIGTPPKNIGYALTQGKWLSLDGLFSVTHSSADYNERDRASIFYSQSWLLVHMMMLSETYGAKFSDFVMQVHTSHDPALSLSKVYGKSLPELDRDLQAYFRGNSIRGLTYKARFEKIAGLQSRPATELEVELNLAKLIALAGKHQEAEARFSKLAASYQNSWEVEEALGHLHWQRGDSAKATEHLNKAVQLNSPSWKVYWDYARLAQSESNLQSVLKALQKAIELNPSLSEARMMLGQEFYRAQKYGESLATLRQLKQLPPDRAASVFLTMADCALRLKEPGAARADAERAKKYATKDFEMQAADDLIRYLDRPQIASGAASEQTQIVDLIPARESFSAEIQREDYQVASGLLDEVDCLGGRARLVVHSGTRKFSLLVRRPESVQIKNSEQATINLTCGKQQNARIIVEYVENADKETGTSGDVRTLEFVTASKQ